MVNERYTYFVKYGPDATIQTLLTAQTLTAFLQHCFRRGLDVGRIWRVARREGNK
jgi:hypothetical protein